MFHPGITSRASTAAGGRLGAIERRLAAPACSRTSTTATTPAVTTATTRAASEVLVTSRSDSSTTLPDSTSVRPRSRSTYRQISAPAAAEVATAVTTESQSPACNKPIGRSREVSGAVTFAALHTAAG